MKQLRRDFLRTAGAGILAFASACATSPPSTRPTSETTNLLRPVSQSEIQAIKADLESRLNITISNLQVEQRDVGGLVPSYFCDFDYGGDLNASAYNTDERTYYFTREIKADISSMWSIVNRDLSLVAFIDSEEGAYQRLLQKEYAGRFQSEAAFTEFNLDPSRREGHFGRIILHEQQHERDRKYGTVDKIVAQILSDAEGETKNYLQERRSELHGMIGTERAYLVELLHSDAPHYVLGRAIRDTARNINPTPDDINRLNVGRAIKKYFDGVLEAMKIKPGDYHELNKESILHHARAYAREKHPDLLY